MAMSSDGRIVGLLMSVCVFLGCSQEKSSASAGPAAPPACADPGDSAPVDVFCTGLYEKGDATEHAKDAIPYTPGLTLWSDGAEKHRFLSLPPGTKIDTTNLDAWKFPVGTKAWKEFWVDGALVETRFLWKQAETNWVEATYIWDANVKSATLTDLSKPTLLDNGYEIPPLKACRKCHGGGSDELLGVEAVALAVAKAEGITLQSLSADGLLSDPPATTDVALPEDVTGKAAAALGYLHINCGAACHSTRGVSGFTQLHTRIRAEELWPAAGGAIGTVEMSDAYQTGVNQDVILATYQQAFPNTKLITPGAHQTSLTWLVAHLRGTHQMPPLASHVVDEIGTQKVSDWIDNLPH